jgi:hypothetical protein
MTTAPATPTTPEKKRSVLTRTQARFVEDALKDLASTEGLELHTRKTLLESINARCAVAAFQITMANMIAAAAIVNITLPGSRDADAERDRELLEQLASTMDKLMSCFDTDWGAIDSEGLRGIAKNWQAFRAGPLFAGKGETQG